MPRIVLTFGLIGGAVIAVMIFQDQSTGTRS